MFPIQNAVPTRYPPLITWALIAVNCAVFFFQVSLSRHELNEFLYHYALVPARYFDPLFSGGAYLTLDDLVPFLTMMFLHGGWLHLILNMWTLWLFAPAIEDRLGHGRFLAFYLTCGVAAAVAHAVFSPISTVPALGASGAIAGVLGSYVRLFPLSRVVVVVPILFIPLFLEVPAFVFIGLWFILQILQGTAELLTPSASAGVAWWAHVGGSVAGFALIPWLIQSDRQYRVYYRDEGELGFDSRGRR